MNTGAKDGSKSEIDSILINTVCALEILSENNMIGGHKW